MLACPICKRFPLRLMVFEEIGIKPPEKVRRCELYCGFQGKMLSELGEPDCLTCYSREIREGILVCEECGRWYPIEEEIPRMLPDELRDENEDKRFLSRWRARIPEEILREGKPFALKGP